MNNIEVKLTYETTSFGGLFGLTMEDCLDELITLYSNYQPDKQKLEGSREEHNS